MVAHFLVERLLTRFKVALDIWLSKKILINSDKTTTFVGKILAFINHRDLMISGTLTSECVIKMDLTCLVPHSIVPWTAKKAEMALLKVI